MHVLFFLALPLLLSWWLWRVVPVARPFKRIIKNHSRDSFDALYKHTITILDSGVLLLPWSGSAYAHKASGKDLRAPGTFRRRNRRDSRGFQPLRYRWIGYDWPQRTQGGDAVAGIRGQEPDDLPNDQRHRQGVLLFWVLAYHMSHCQWYHRVCF